MHTCISAVTKNEARVSESLQKMDDEQAAREALATARQAKLAAAFTRGGGEALHTSLAQQARAAEERTLRQAARCEADQAAKAQRDRAAKIRRNREYITGLNAQVLLYSTMDSYAPRRIGVDALGQQHAAAVRTGSVS
jgi:hypothetical protein